MPPMPGSPAVAVVIATHGRAALLAQALDALERQTRQDFELIVVDDDSRDATPAVLETRGVRTIRVSRRGPGLARQIGWQAATAPIIAFTDDDCVPSPGWLEALVRPIEEGRADFSQGPTLPRPDQADRMGPWARTMRVEKANKRFPTCNMAYRRSVLEELGGFREEFVGPRTAGEDADLGWRALAAGRRFEFVPAALVHHEVWPSSWTAFVKDRPRWGMIVQVVRYHPAARELAYRRYFYNPRHPRFLVAFGVLLVAGAVRRWLPAVLLAAMVGAYVTKTRGSHVPAGRRALHLVQVLAADAVEVAVFARASVRYRTILL